MEYAPRVFRGTKLPALPHCDEFGRFISPGPFKKRAKAVLSLSVWEPAWFITREHDFASATQRPLLPGTNDIRESRISLVLIQGNISAPEILLCGVEEPRRFSRSRRQ